LRPAEPAAFLALIQSEPLATGLERRGAGAVLGETAPFQTYHAARATMWATSGKAGHAGGSCRLRSQQVPQFQAALLD